MTDWLSDFVNQHSELEPPISFWRWSGIAAISAVVKDSVWLHRQIYNLYPNIYVMFHAESGLKKGPPVSAAKQIVKLVANTKVISGRSSIQGILKELGTGQTQQGGKIVGGSTAFICSSELTSSIVDDPVATQILTDLYDRNYNIGEWQSLLKMETFSLRNPTITMLTATNEAMSEDFFGRKDVQGGYFARTFIIHETKRNKPHSLLYQLSHPPDYNKSAEYLRELAKLKGEFKPLASLEGNDEYKYERKKENRLVYFNEAGIIYEDWYTNFLQSIDEQEIKDDTGTLNRFGDSVLKVAILLSLAKRPELEISPESITEAIDICEKLVGNVRKTTMGRKGTAISSSLKGMILHELLNREPHIITRDMLMKKMWMHFSGNDEWNDLMLSFHTSGAIMTENIGDKVVYRMPDEIVQQYKEYLAGKMEGKE